MLKLYGCFSDLYIKMKDMAPQNVVFFRRTTSLVRKKNLRRFCRIIMTKIGKSEGRTHEKSVSFNKTARNDIKV